MNRELFFTRKGDLIKLITDHLTKNNWSKKEERSLKTLLEILNQYSFENRLEKKGLLLHTVVDSLTLEYALGERFIKFDNDIK